MTTDTDAQFKIETKKYLKIADIEGLRISCGDKPQVAIEGELDFFLKDDKSTLTTFLPKCTSQPTDVGQAIKDMVLALSALIGKLKTSKEHQCMVAFAIKKSD
jgi:hypothetical protein